MELPPEEMVAVINRLKRAQGQLAGVIKMLQEGDAAALDTAKMEKLFLSLA